MADEINVRVSLSVRADNVEYSSKPTTYRADLEAARAKGPTPGAVAVSTSGTDVSLSELTNPGFCHIRNIDLPEEDGGNAFQYGIWDPETSRFYPFGELRPGEAVVFRFARDFGEEYTNTGTGTTAATNRLRCKALGGASIAVVEAFEL